jgi:hypothetical protein
MASVCTIISLLPLNGKTVLPLGRLRARCFRMRGMGKKTKELILNLLAIMNRY